MLLILYLLTGRNKVLRNCTTVILSTEGRQLKSVTKYCSNSLFRSNLRHLSKRKYSENPTQTKSERIFQEQIFRKPNSDKK
jgi:hypothetical protein